MTLQHICKHIHGENIFWHADVRQIWLMKRYCQRNTWNSGGDGSHNSCFHFPLSALCGNPRTFYCRAFLLSPLSWIYNNDNYLPYVSFQLKSSRKIILLESPHQVHLSPPTYCQDKHRPLPRWGWCRSTCFLFQVWLPASLASYKMMRREKTESILVHDYKVSWCLDFQANLKETNEVLLTMSETTCKSYVILSNIDNIISPIYKYSSWKSSLQ